MIILPRVLAMVVVVVYVVEVVEVVVAAVGMVVGTVIGIIEEAVVVLWKCGITLSKAKHLPIHTT